MILTLRGLWGDTDRDCDGLAAQRRVIRLDGDLPCPAGRGLDPDGAGTAGFL